MVAFCIIIARFYGILLLSCVLDFYAKQIGAGSALFQLLVSSIALSGIVCLLLLLLKKCCVLQLFCCVVGFALVVYVIFINSSFLILPCLIKAINK